MKTHTATFASATPVGPGDAVLLARDAVGPDMPLLRPSGPMPSLRAGDVLAANGAPLFRALGRIRPPAPGRNGSRPAWVLEALGTPSPGDTAFTVEPCALSLAWITVSDKGFAGRREDTAGPAVERVLSEVLDIEHAAGFLVPDEPGEITALIADLALVQGYGLVVATGGTGVAPRDTTPEAALKVLDKRLPGFEQAMLAASLAKTPHAAVSRAVAGTAGESIVLTLPGSPKAVAEILPPLAKALAHALKKLRGDASDCASAT